MLDAVITITEFKNQLKARGYSDRTIENYGKNLDMFARFLEAREIKDMRDINNNVLRSYKGQLMDDPTAMETKAVRIRAVKRLFEYLAETHKLLINPAEGIVETSRKNRKIGTVLTVDEVKSLLAQPNLSLKTHIRDRAIMEVLYSTGIRLDELLSLEVYHVDLKDKVLYIRKGKGKKQRVVPLGKNAARHLREYLEKIRPYYARKNPKERRVFLLNTGVVMNPSSVRAFIRTYRVMAGIKKPVSPHALRRTCATHLLQQGADIRYIQELLGHSHLSTTQMYTKIMPVEVKETHDKTHPKVE
jgi:integrase/recombinase XerD